MSKTKDLVTATVAPLLPYAIGGLVLYFFGGKILAVIGSKISGVSTEEFIADASVVKSAISTPIDTASDVFSFVTGIKTTVPQGKIPVPYPTPQSQEQYRANIAAIDAALAARKLQ
jgi:hypothetical protein